MTNDKIVNVQSNAGFILGFMSMVGLQQAEAAVA